MYRRAVTLICYWEGRSLIVENYLRRTRAAVTPRACELLQFFDRWRPAADLAATFPKESAASLAHAVTHLVRAGLLEYGPSRAARARTPVDAWQPWSPAAAFFHFSTKDAHAPIAPEDSVRVLRARARVSPMPPSVKTYAKVTHLDLPPPPQLGEFPRTLLARRSWRRFASGPIDREQLAALLGLTFGVQWWFDLYGVGRVPLKTAPSGGSRHPIEAYVLALHVDGVRPGLYHYDAGSHRLELLRRGARPSQVTRYLNGQKWTARCAALVLMTGVFERTRWKYPAPKAYRVVLVEAGHLCQTLCLVATWLGLAPFCTMALADSAIERDLAIDGIGESILYTAGVGQLPRALAWAPWHSGAFGRRVPNRAMTGKRRTR